LKSTSSSIHLLAQYEKLLWNKDSQQLEEVEVSMTTACSIIIEFQARAACHLQRNLAESTFRNAFKRDGWEKLRPAMEKAEADVKGCAERKGWQDIQKILKTINQQEMKQETIDREKKVDDFLQLLLSNGCLYLESKNRNHERVTGTCDWFTNHDLFKQWNLPIKSPALGLLYVTADPGCGKSVLSRYLIDQELPNDGRTVCYFFFKDDFEQQKSSLRALCTLLHQIFVSNRRLLTDDILEKYNAQGKRFFESFFAMWSTLLAAAAQQEIVCVLDALDECQDDDMNQLIDAITSIYNNGLSKTTKTFGLKFLLTSRPYQRIRREVSRGLKSQMASIHLQGDCGPTANEIVEEIKLVVESKIDETADSFCLELDERQLMKERLNAVPNRTYLWINLVFEGLMNKRDGITKRDIMDLTDKLPQSVDDAYEKMLNTSSNREKSKRLLHLVLGAKRPLILSEMSVALAFTGQQSCDYMASEIIPENRMKVDMRDMCGLFVVVVDKRIYLLHQTAREFLVRGDSDKKKVRNGQSSNPKNNGAATTIWKHSIDPTDSNSVLAKMCISYLQWDSATENTSMFEYSATYWVDHYFQSGERCKAEVAETTRNLCLLSERRTQWTQIYSQKNMIPVTGSPLCLASSLGLERAVKLFLHELDPNSVDLVNEVNSEEGEYGQTPLSWAAEKGHEAVVQLLLKTDKVEVDSKDSHGRTPLSKAAENGHEAVVQLLLERDKVEVNSKDSYGRTPLSWAAKKGHEAVVQLLLERDKVEVDSKDNSGRTPLSWAAEKGHEAVVQLLLKTDKVEVNSKDSENGRTPLLWAAEKGYTAVVQLLLKTDKVEVNSKDSENGRTPLLWAAEKGYTAVVQLLLKTDKVEVNSKDSENGRTPLLWAAEKGYTAVVQLLLKTDKVEVNSKDSKYGRTPLLWAAEKGHEAVVQLLLETDKVEVDSKDSEYGGTPLLWAAKKGHNAVVQLLLETDKVEVDSKDIKYGRTPLSWAAGKGYETEIVSKHVNYRRKPPLRRTLAQISLVPSWAAENGHKAVVQLLLETDKVEVDSKDSSGRTPLSWATENEHEAVVQLLLETDKVEVDSKDSKYSRTPLLWAAKKGHEAIVQLLLKTDKVEVNSKDSENGRTPLLWAAKKGHEAVVQLLLEMDKVEVDLKDSSGRTSLSWAAANGHEAVVQLLLKTGKTEVDSKDSEYGRTPLSWAAENGRKAVVQLLLETDKVEVDSKDNSGQTPLSWATKKGHVAVVELLLEMDEVEVDD
jgi:ankyrin repeat protein